MEAKARYVVTNVRTQRKGHHEFTERAHDVMMPAMPVARVALRQMWVATPDWRPASFTVLG